MKSALKKVGAVVVGVLAFLNRKVFSKIGKKIAPFIKKLVNNTRTTEKIEELNSPKTITEVREKIEKPIKTGTESVDSYKPTPGTSHRKIQRKTVSTKREFEFKGKNDTLDFDSDFQGTYDDIQHHQANY